MTGSEEPSPEVTGTENLLLKKRNIKPRLSPLCLGEGSLRGFFFVFMVSALLIISTAYPINVLYNQLRIQSYSVYNHTAYTIMLLIISILLL